MRRLVLRVPLLAAILLLALSGGMLQRASGRTISLQPEPRKVFDLTVSLEWQPGEKDLLVDDLVAAGCPRQEARELFLDDLIEGLRQTSAYLYTYSEGQMALGKVNIYTDGANWESADIRILADSAYRPTAFVGGIERVRRNYTAATGHTITFSPGEIFLGRLWSGSGARCGGWSQPAGWRTIGHEFAHYALYLFDEYYNESTRAAQYCTTDPAGIRLLGPGEPVGSSTTSLNDSLMAYHYTADKLWLDSSSVPDGCNGTPQAVVHGKSDWDTIVDFYGGAGVARPGAATVGPDFTGSPAAALFAPSVIQPAAVPPNTSAVVALAPLARPNLIGQTYLVHQEKTDNGTFMRILGQGDLPAGKASVFFGVKPGDRAAVLVQDWVTGERSYFPKTYTSAPPLVPGAKNVLKATPSAWCTSMAITPRAVKTLLPPVPNAKPEPVSEVAGLNVHLQDCRPQIDYRYVEMAYCPAGGTCEPFVQVVATPPGNVFDHTFTFLPADGKDEPPARHGYIYVRVPEGTSSTSAGSETISWYQLAGGVGPAHTEGHAALLDGLVNVDALKSSAAFDGSWALYSPAQICVPPGTRFVLPRGVLGIVGQPVRVQAVVMPAGAPGPDQKQIDSRTWSPKDPPVQVRLSYNQDLLDQLGISEAQLVVLRLRGQTQDRKVWEPVPIVDRSLALDWLSVQEQPFNVNGDGQGDIYALGYVRPAAWLPLVVR